MTTMTDEQLAAIRARCSAVPDTKLIMLDSDNDLFDELAIHMVRDQLLVGEIAWLNKDDVSRAYGEIFAHARADIPALLAYIDELLAEVERLRAEVERLRDAELGRMVRGEGRGVCEGTLVVREDNGDWHVRRVDEWEVVE